MIQKKEAEIIETFSIFDNVSDRFQYIVDQKNDKYKIEEKYKTNINKVHGCQSDLWIIGELNIESVNFKYFSAGIFPNGITKILLDIIDGSKIEEILHYNPIFLEETDLINFISPNRKIGFQSLLKKIKEIAIELDKNEKHN